MSRPQVMQITLEGWDNGSHGDRQGLLTRRSGRETAERLTPDPSERVLGLEGDLEGKKWAKPASRVMAIGVDETRRKTGR